VHSMFYSGVEQDGGGFIIVSSLEIFEYLLSIVWIERKFEKVTRIKYIDGLVVGRIRSERRENRCYQEQNEQNEKTNHFGIFLIVSCFLELSDI